MFVLLLLTLLFSPSSMASAPPLCLELFAVKPSSSIPQTLLDEVAKLHPGVAERSSHLQELYLELRKEEASLRQNAEALTPEQTERLYTHFADKYNLPETSSALKQFYLNATVSLYSRVAWQWKKETVEQMSGMTLKGPTLKVAQALMDFYFPYQSMAATVAPLPLLIETLALQLWRSYPWKEALMIADRWFADPSSKNGFFFFFKWLDKQTDLPQISFADLERLQGALSKKPAPVVCCASSSACISCPNNLHWHKD